LLQCSGKKRVRPSRTAAIAGSASGLVRTNHCVERSGSTTAGSGSRCDRERVRLAADQRAVALEVGDDALARDGAIEAGIRPGRGGHLTALVDHRDEIEAVARGHLEVVEVVRRRDLDGAGAELAIDVRIGDDRDLAAEDRQAERLADQRGVALVLGMHGDRGVAEHGLRDAWSRRRSIRCRRRADSAVPELALDVLVLDLDVGERGAAAAAPVDEPAPAVDQPFLVEPDEDLAHRARQALVHREALARPVARRTEALQLRDDVRRDLVLPGEGAGEELLASDLMAIGPSAASFRSTTFCVAIEAWSVPGIHTALYPSMRFQRMSTSWRVC
jgi:hypothetical protein